MIRVNHLTKSYGPQLLFADASFSLHQGERAGVVGRNGSGKTSLFRLLTGAEEPDEGRIERPKDYRIGYLEQQLRFTRPTLLAEAMTGLPPEQQDDAWRAEKVLFGLGFTADDVARPPETFSGGYQVRLHLAKVLVSGADLLLLDEPTNYLDIISIRWLEQFLRNWPGELLLITHDRRFMDQVCTHILGIHRQKIRKRRGDTHAFFCQLAEEEAVHEKTRLNDEKKRRETERFITRFRAKARLAGLVQSRVKALEKAQKLEKLEKLATLDFDFPSLSFPAPVMLEARDLAFRYQPEQPWLFENLSLTVGRHDRVAVIGKNGRGKTTLLRVLAGELPPSTGSLKTHPSLALGYFGQTNIERLSPDRTIEEEWLATDPAVTRQKARNLAGVMMFSGDAALKKIAVLSGGEKSRVLLGKLLLFPSQLLLLDEPTHHLDMESCEELLEAIEQFEGSVVMVTHDERFLHQMATRLVVFDRGRARIFEGGYQDFLERVGWEDEASVDTASPSAVVSPPTARRDLKKERARLVQEKSACLNPLENRLRALELEIEQTEEALTENRRRLVIASEEKNVAAIADLPKAARTLEHALNTLYAELTLLSEERDRLAAGFEARFQDLSK